MAFRCRFIGYRDKVFRYRAHHCSMLSATASVTKCDLLTSCGGCEISGALTFKNRIVKSCLYEQLI